MELRRVQNDKAQDNNEDRFYYDNSTNWEGEDNNKGDDGGSDGDNNKYEDKEVKDGKEGDKTEDENEIEDRSMKDGFIN